MIHLAARGLRAVLLDIEGTTTPIAFVHEVLFAYARAHLREYLKRRWADADIGDVRRKLADEHEAEQRSLERQSIAWRSRERTALRDDPDSTADYALWLMDRDRKSPGLKLLQGLIWEDGYQAGVLRGQVFDDVPGAMRRWHAAGIAIAIYSSGSELAQRRLFQSTGQGDLASLITAFFDTSVGAKKDRTSYERIATLLGRGPAQILFVSDVVEELDAARAAGMPGALSLRPGNPPQSPRPFDTIQSLSEIEP